MSWQRELDELRAARAHGARDGRRRQGAAPARGRPAHRARAHRAAGRRRQLPRGRRHRRQGRVRRRRQPEDAHARQLRHGPGQHRRPAGGRAGRRLHGARRLGRRHHPHEADPGRAHGQRAAAADHPHHRGLGRRRLGQDHRDHGARQPAGPARHLPVRLPVPRRQPRHRAGRRAGPRLGRRPRRRAAGGQPLLGHDQVHLGHVRGRARRWWRGIGQNLEQAGAGRLGGAVPGRRRRPCGRHRGGGVRVRPPLPVLPAVLGLQRGAARPSAAIRADRREEMLFSRHPARPAQGLQDAARSSTPSSTRARSSRWARCSAGR